MSSQSHPSNTTRRENGQALAEYALILVFVAISSMIVVGAVGPTVARAYSTAACVIRNPGTSASECSGVPASEPADAAAPPVEVEAPPEEDEEPKEAHGTIHFNQSPSVTVGRTDKPRLTVTYSNDGDVPLENVQIVCDFGSGAANFVSSVNDGLFGSSHKTANLLTYSGLSGGLAVGQSSAVDFKVNPNRGNAQVRCTLQANDMASVSDTLAIVVQ